MGVGAYLRLVTGDGIKYLKIAVATVLLEKGNVLVMQ